MKKICINPPVIKGEASYEEVPQYSQGIKIEVGNTDMIFISGQVATDNDGKVIGLGDMNKQATVVFEKIKKILEDSGATLRDVVKITMFIADAKEFPELSKVRNSYFPTEPPAASAFEVSRLLKEGLMVEIEAIAVRPKQETPR